MKYDDVMKLVGERVAVQLALPIVMFDVAPDIVTDKERFTVLAPIFEQAQQVTQPGQQQQGGRLMSAPILPVVIIRKVDEHLTGTAVALEYRGPSSGLVHVIVDCELIVAVFRVAARPGGGKPNASDQI